MGRRIFRVDVVRSPVLWQALRRTLPRSCQLTAIPAPGNRVKRVAISPCGLPATCAFLYTFNRTKRIRPRRHCRTERFEREGDRSQCYLLSSYRNPLALSQPIHRLSQPFGEAPVQPASSIKTVRAPRNSCSFQMPKKVSIRVVSRGAFGSDRAGIASPISAKATLPAGNDVCSPAFVTNAISGWCPRAFSRMTSPRAVSDYSTKSACQ